MPHNNSVWTSWLCIVGIYGGPAKLWGKKKKNRTHASLLSCLTSPPLPSPPLRLLLLGLTSNSRWFGRHGNSRRVRAICIVSAFHVSHHHAIIHTLPLFFVLTVSQSVPPSVRPAVALLLDCTLSSPLQASQSAHRRSSIT